MRKGDFSEKSGKFAVRMLKFYNTDVVFQEIPDEVTLAVNLTNCPCRCPGCHSKFLWADVGDPLDEQAIDRLVSEFGSDITCICFMGGDAAPKAVDTLAQYVRRTHPRLKTGWYTGRTIISPLISRENFDYIKVGPFIAHLGPLKSPRTNQRLFRVNHVRRQMEDITARFWK